MADMARLKLLMRTLSVAMAAGFGFSHLFFPARYFHAMGQLRFDATDPFTLFLANTTGLLIIALCVGLWIAASDPIRYRVVAIQFLVAGVLTFAVFFYHLVFTAALSGWEWLNLLLIGAATYFMSAWYPWRESGRKGSDVQAP